MELTNIIIVSLSIATASSTPHGYGTKGGAIAKSGAVAGAGAATFPEFGGPAGAGGGSYSSSGSFSKSSAASFASASSGSFSFGGSGGYGGYGGGSSGGVGIPGLGAPGAADNGANGRGDGGYGGGYSPDAGGAPIAGANANAFASAQAGIHGGLVPGSPNAPCTGNCHPPDEEKQQQPDCQGSSCVPSPQAPKCTSGACDASSAVSSTFAGNNGGHGPGSPDAPCTGNCPSPDQEKQQQPNCPGPTCGRSPQAPKCTSGACDTNAAIGSAVPSSYGGHGSGSPNVPCTGSCLSPDQEKPQQPNCQGPTCGPSPQTPKCTSGACDTSAVIGSALPSSYGGHGSGSPNVPCTGNCPSPDQKKQQEPNCQGPGCEPKCTSGACDMPAATVGLPDSQSFEQSLSKGSVHPKDLPSGFVSVDDLDRPGKVSVPGPNDAPSHGNKKDHPQSPKSGEPGHQLCSSNGCGNILPHGGDPCTSPDCGQAAPIIPGSCTSPGCGKISPVNGAGAFANSNAKANAGAVAGTNGNVNPPQVNPSFVRTPILNTKPNFGLPEDKSKEAQYGGGFGGPPGILKPNDYSVVSKPIHSLQPGSHSFDSTPNIGHNGLQGVLPHKIPQGLPSQPSIYQQPPSLQNPTYPAHGSIPSGTYVHGQKPSSGHYVVPGFTGSGAFAGAAAGASASAYTGSFGGPPGILKPNDFSFHGVKPSGFTRPHGDKIPSVAHQQIGPSPIQPVPHYDETPYQGGFGGAPGVIRPNGPSGTGTFPTRQPEDKYQTSIPQQIFPGKPDNGCITGLEPVCSGLSQAQGKPESAESVHPIKPSSSCGPGSICGDEGTYHGGFGGAPGIIRPNDNTRPQETYPSTYPTGLSQAQSKPESTGSVHPIKPSSSCGPGSVCGDKETYHGGFGGAPGIIRPTDTVGPTEINSPETPASLHTQHSNSDSGHKDGSIYQTHFGAAADTGSYTSGSNDGPKGAGADNGVTAGATSGATGGYGDYQGGYGAHQGGYGGHQGGHGDHLGGYPYHQGGYGGQGAYGSAGGAFGTKSTGSVKGCSSGCGGGNVIGSYGASGVDNAGFHGGLGGALAVAKSVAGSFALAGAGAGAGAEAGAGAGAGAAAVAGAGARAGGAGGHYGQGGSFASAQASASASAKSYGGYH